MSGNAILKYRGHAKVTEKVALCLAFMYREGVRTYSWTILC